MKELGKFRVGELPINLDVVLRVRLLLHVHDRRCFNKIRLFL